MGRRPNLSVVGNLTIDILPTGERIPGGSPWYAGLAAAAMGCEVSVIASVGDGYPRQHIQYLERHGVKPIINFSDKPSTTYSSSWSHHKRILRLIHPGPPIPTQMLEYIYADAVLFSPVAGEISIQDIRSISCKLRCVDLQGFLRTTGEDGVVTLKRLASPSILEAAVVHASHEEVEAATGLRSVAAAAVRLAQMGAEHLIIGLREGVLVISREMGDWLVPSQIMGGVDATGAGDILTGAFIANLLEIGPDLRGLAAAVALVTDSIARPPPYRVAGTPDPLKIQKILDRAIKLD
ncbi:MAG: PfkB family carbohydrate kinase [Nitrososphaerota archaeon]